MPELPRHTVMRFYAEALNRAGVATLEIDIQTLEVRNVATGKSLHGKALPDIYRAMILAGGEKPYLKARLEAEHAARA